MKKLAMLTALGLMATALAATAALARPVDDFARGAKAAAPAAAPEAAKGGAAAGVVQKRGEKTIFDIAAGNDNFDTLEFLLKETGLDAVVNSNDVTLTVFAPTDDAFKKLFDANKGLKDVLLADKQLLTSVLLYHVTDGRRFSNSVFNQNNNKTVDMLSGGTITTRPDLKIIDFAGQMVNPLAKEGLINISASNGVIHAIDTVLLPIKL